MKVLFGFFAALLAIGCLADLSAQTTTSPITSTLQTSLQAMVGQQSLADLTLSGTAEAIAGSDDETGSFTFRATSAGSSRVDLVFTNGTRSETRQYVGGAPSGQWMDESGAVHTSVQHNLMAGYWWATPSLIINNLLTDSNIAVVFVGNEGTLEHFSAYHQLAGAPTGVNTTLQALTQFDLWLDATTQLPAKLSFSIHPDTNAGINIPIEVQFSNYQTMSGLLMPGHVQKFVNGTLVLDAQIQSVSINSGLAASTFSLQ